MKTSEWKVAKFASGRKWQCWTCRCELTEASATVDHLTPRSRGGTDAGSNYKLACVDCNTRRGNAPLRRADIDRLKGRERPRRKDFSQLAEAIKRSRKRKETAMDSNEQIERGMQLAKECANKHANDANWHALRAHLERMTQTIPGGAWSNDNGPQASPQET